MWNIFLTNLYDILLWISSSVPPSPNWSHCSGLGRLAKKWELFPPTFHLSYSNQPKRFVIQMNTGNINKTTVGSHNQQNLNLISWNKLFFGVINVSRRGGSALMNCFCLLFRPETRFLKSFTANILSQFRALHFTRSDRGQGGAHYHHIQPVKSPQTDFTQMLPLVKWYISTPLAF